MRFRCSWSLRPRLRSMTGACGAAVLEGVITWRRDFSVWSFMRRSGRGSCFLACACRQLAGPVRRGCSWLLWRRCRVSGRGDGLVASCARSPRHVIQRGHKRRWTARPHYSRHLMPTSHALTRCADAGRAFIAPLHLVAEQVAAKGGHRFSGTCRRRPAQWPCLHILMQQ